MQQSLLPEFVTELTRIDSVNRNRQTLNHFVDLAKHHMPGRQGYIYTYQHRGKKAAQEEMEKGLERLKRACKRADVSYDAVCQEHHLNVH